MRNPGRFHEIGKEESLIDTLLPDPVVARLEAYCAVERNAVVSVFYCVDKISDCLFGNILRPGLSHDDSAGKCLCALLAEPDRDLMRIEETAGGKDLDHLEIADVMVRKHPSKLRPEPGKQLAF